MSVQDHDTETVPAFGGFPSHSGNRQASRRRRTVIAGAAVVVIAVGLVVGATDPFANKKPTNGAAGNGNPPSTATVARRDLASQTNVQATLGYAGSYSAVNQAKGTYTALPAVGQVVNQGQSLYSVDGSPVGLLYGSVPSYRDLSEGTSGPDVTELNADLVALGYAASSQLDPTSDYFSAETASALEQFQATLGVAQTGTLTLGQAVFLPSAARVTAVSVTLGTPAQSGQPVLTASSTSREVTIALDASQQSEVAVGDKVTIILPNNQTTPGVISSVGTVATASSSGSSGSSGSSTPTITVGVNPSDPAATGSWDQAPVQVSITTASVSNVLVVPVDALLARSSGGYAVEVVAGNGLHHLVPVTLGLFDDADGLAQVSGSGLTVGDHVVVPGL